MEKKYTKLLCSCLVGIGLVSCGSSSGKSNNSGGSTTMSYNVVPITISTPSIIPILGGNATHTVMFVHNNTTKAISDINYSVIGGSNNKMVIDDDSAKGCKSIPAGGVCRVGITTPVGVDQGSNLVQARYINPVDKTNRTYKQLFQYQASNSLDVGVPFTANTALVAEDGKGNGHKALYYYVPGKSVYKISSSVNSKSVTVVDRTVADNQEVVGGVTVFAYDLSLPLNVTQAATSSNGSLLFNVSAIEPQGGSRDMRLQVGTQSGNQTALLSLGLAPMLDSSIESTFVVPIINHGNATADISSIVLSGLSSGATIADNNCSSTLPPGDACEVTISIPVNSINTDILKANYRAVGTSSPVYTTSSTSLAWYKSALNPVISYIYTVPYFYATQGGSSIVTLTNVIANSATVTVQSIEPVQSASSTSNVSANLVDGIKPCASNALSANNSCTFGISINDNNARPSGNIVFLVTGVMANGSIYKRYITVNYVAQSYYSSLNLSDDAGFSLIGDNLSNSTRTFTLSNNGAAPAELESFIVAENVSNASSSWFNVVESGGLVVCSKGTVLNSGDSCNFKVVMGPISSSDIVAPLTESGLVPVKVSYYQVGSPTVESTTKLYNYSVSPNNQDVGIGSVAVVGGSGTGSSADPVVFNGSDTSSKQVSIEYANTGTNPITILSLNNQANPFLWTLSGTCTTGVVLLPGEKCTVIYDSAVSTYSSTGYQGYSANTNANITSPEMGIKDNVTGDVFVSTADNFPDPINAPVLYADVKLATVVNMAEQTNGETFITQTVTNADNYTPFTITMDMEDYFDSAASASGCGLSIANGVLTQTCTSSGNGSFHPTLINAVWATGATLNINFGVTGTNGQSVLNTPIFMQSIIESNPWN